MNRMIRIALSGIIVFSMWTVQGSIDIVPRPLELEEASGRFEVNASTKINYSKGAESTAGLLVEALAPAMGFALKARRGTKSGEGIFLNLVEDDSSTLGDEGYRLTVDSNGVEISAPTNAGLFYGVQSLRQLLPVEVFATIKTHADWSIPFVSIVDKPRFVWRGMHLDVARHFMSKEEVMKFIDTLAVHKFNTFHWHLTEDQGWRVEIKKYPRLTEVGAWREGTVIGHALHYIEKKIPFVYDSYPHGGFYTQEDIKEVVAYAAERHITIVPEIELPGHAQAAVHAYPEFGVTGEEVGVMREWGVSPHLFSPEEKTIEFLKDVFDEVLQLFPGEYIHVGGDEADKSLWESSPRVHELLKERGLKDMHEMQSWFVKQIDEYLTENGRRLIGWDEILEGGLAKGATVMSWRGNAGGIAAARAGHDVVIAPNDDLYFNHYQSKDRDEPFAIGGLTTLRHVYDYEPVPEELTAKEAEHVLGAQGQLWSEYLPHAELVEYMAYPRACALAEMLWLPADDKNWDRFSSRLETHLKRLSLQQINFRRPHIDTAKKTNRYQN